MHDRLISLQDKKTKIIGFDYGSRYAGTTACCYLEDQILQCYQTNKKQDADEFVLIQIATYGANLVGIDAPLSLPLAYYDDKSSDYMFRRADRELKAMSPMFLGGLTARAMRLQHSVRPQAKLIEVYPAATVRHRHPELMPVYKENLKTATKIMRDILAPIVIPDITSWHAFDALLAWYITALYSKDGARSAGIETEGIIYY